MRERTKNPAEWRANEIKSALVFCSHGHICIISCKFSCLIFSLSVCFSPKQNKTRRRPVHLISALIAQLQTFACFVCLAVFFSPPVFSLLVGRAESVYCDENLYICKTINSRIDSENKHTIKCDDNNPNGVDGMSDQWTGLPRYDARSLTFPSPQQIITMRCIYDEFNSKNSTHAT